MNPTSGEISSDKKTSVALAQLIPSVKCRPLITALAMPTPMIEPISVWLLDAGSPRYHVPRFHRIAEISSAKIIANPAPEPTLMTSSTGSSARIVSAIIPLLVSTPARLHMPDHITATHGFSVWV